VLRLGYCIGDAASQPQHGLNSFFDPALAEVQHLAKGAVCQAEHRTHRAMVDLLSHERLRR
jgi:hypothetical protein